MNYCIKCKACIAYSSNAYCEDCKNILSCGGSAPKEEPKVLVKTLRIDEIIEFADDYQSESTHDRTHINKIVEMLEKLKGN